MKFRVCFLLLLIGVFTVYSNAEAAKFILQGRAVETNGNDDKDVEIYYNPGWVTNTLDERGIWIGNSDLDKLNNDLRIVAQLVYPNGIKLDLNAKSLRENVIGVINKLEENLFIMDREYANEQNILPFLHTSVVVLPAGDVYAITCNVRLLEDINLKRDSWSKDFVWQAITWEKEKLFIAKGDQVVSDIKNALNTILEDFVKQYLSDRNTRIDIDAEEEFIRKEVDDDFKILEKQAQ